LYQDFTNEKDEGTEYYDDFDFVVGGGDDGKDSTLQQRPSPSTLQDRLQELAMTEQANQQQVSDNWREGYWNVWGCSLDPYSTDVSSGEDDDGYSLSPKTVITCLRLVPSSSSSTFNDGGGDCDTALLIVGRSDGSICWLRMDVSPPPSLSSYDTTTKSLRGRSMVTYFENKLTTKSTNDGGFIVGTQLRRSDNPNVNRQPQEFGNDDNATDHPPFDIVAQLSMATTTGGSTNAAILDMLILQDTKMLWTISQESSSSSSSNTIQVWALSNERHNPDDDDDDDDDDSDGLLLPAPAQMTQPPFQLRTIHTSSIVGMKVVPTNNQHDLVVTVSDNGLVVVWEVKGQHDSGDPDVSIILEDNVLEQHQQGEEQRSDIVLSMDVDKDHLYLGCQSGRIFIFSLSSIFAHKERRQTPTTALPLLKTFVGFTNREPGVSALCAAGPGSLRSASPSGGGRSSVASTAATSLIAGNVLGELKQWELIPTGADGSGLEYWPRMASQRLPNKAHVFETDQVFLSSEEESDVTSRTIRGLMCVQKVILAATNRDLTFWDPETGKVLYDMKGLNFDVCGGGQDRPSLVVARDSILVTNGMEQYGKPINAISYLPSLPVTLPYIQLCCTGLLVSLSFFLPTHPVCVHDFAMDRVTSENARDMIERDDDD
jgi:hypothetical protein